MRKRIYLHIGAHKTGTTSVQTVLTDNRADLAARGFLYPVSCVYAKAQHRLAFAMKASRDPSLGDHPVLAMELAALMDEISGSPLTDVIISSLEFFSTKPAGLERLAAAFSGHEVRVLAVIRRPDELFSSIYNQRIKGAATRTRESYLRYIDDPVSLHEDMHFERCLSRWAETFGKAAIQVQTYEHGADAVTSFCAHLGIDAGTLLRRPSRANESRDPRALELIRLAKIEGVDPDTIEAMGKLAEARFAQDGIKSGLLAPTERLAVLRAMDAITDETFAAFLGGRANIYRSDLFKLEDFPAQARLTTRDLTRLLADAMRVV